MTERPEWHELPESPADEHRRRLIEQHAERGYREAPLHPDSPPAELVSLLPGLLPPLPAREERGAA
jgi:hypothetical protein